MNKEFVSQLEWENEIRPKDKMTWSAIKEEIYNNPKYTHLGEDFLLEIKERMPYTKTENGAIFGFTNGIHISKQNPLFGHFKTFYRQLKVSIKDAYRDTYISVGSYDGYLVTKLRNLKISYLQRESMEDKLKKLIEHNLDLSPARKVEIFMDNVKNSDVNIHNKLVEYNSNLVDRVRNLANDIKHNKDIITDREIDLFPFDKYTGDADKVAREFYQLLDDLICASNALVSASNSIYDVFYPGI